MPGFINEHLRNGKVVLEILPFTHRPLIIRRCLLTVVPETTPLALRILAKQLVEPLKPSSVEYNIHIDHILHARTHTFVTTKHWGWLFLNFKRGHHVSHDKLSIVLFNNTLCVLVETPADLHYKGPASGVTLVSGLTHTCYLSTV